MSAPAISLQALRQDVAARGLDGLLVPRADCFAGEEVRACDERLAAVSGFTGSAGLALVMATGPCWLLTDGRYGVQAQQEVAGADWRISLKPLGRQATEQAEDHPDLTGLRLGYDAWLHAPDGFDRLEQTTFVPFAENLVDAHWVDRPAPSQTTPTYLPEALSGEDSAAKAQRVLAQTDGLPLLITRPDSLAWLMNWRAQDLPCTPVSLQFGLLEADGAVRTFAPDARADLLATLQGRAVAYDPRLTCAALQDVLVGEQGEGVAQPCPIIAMKAQKNSAEADASRAAHGKDARAFKTFLAWYHSHDLAQLCELGELDLVAKLEACRRQDLAYAGPSFNTICGSGANGAIIHYRVDAQSNRRLKAGELIVLDSGGQYPGATTDVTRTLAVGPISAELRRHITLVLRGMIALSVQIFPAGTTGHQLDVLARSALWNAQLNYAHGTGHGVGAGLSVHESPPNISTRAPAALGQGVLRPGMIVSNEPGYYLPGSHGIRIENLLLVVEVAPGWLGFETLTKVPIDTATLDLDLLTQAEREWLEAYTKDVHMAQDAP